MKLFLAFMWWSPCIIIGIYKTIITLIIIFLDLLKDIKFLEKIENNCMKKVEKHLKK